ncbi:hypothetical protein [Ornithinibacillus halotolerans]|uniref:YhfM-like domain-containing protein n=1 Tax=Ornithinibacillus halotolerans TaxID=1274357 RepID=A0A916RJS8_9BACI|nr:hypothetical protein [Ornithinibacillus halotolerans]GGA60034.1 hypothetical protein GCM10008025_00080 [Ornithinibacillus halotolerans]
MKKFSVMLTLFIISISLIGCQGQAKGLEIEKITIYQLKNNTNKIVIEDKESTKIIKEAVSSAKKVQGIVNVANPEYRIEFGKKTYFLWIEEKSGTIMDSEDTHTIYSISDNSTKEINMFISALYKK